MKATKKVTPLSFVREMRCHACTIFHTIRHLNVHAFNLSLK